MKTPENLPNFINTVFNNLRESCYHCEGKGYIEVRDCTGEIQRSETCLFCDGTGVKKEQEDED